MKRKASDYTSPAPSPGEQDQFIKMKQYLRENKHLRPARLRFTSQLLEKMKAQAQALTDEDLS